MLSASWLLALPDFVPYATRIASFGAWIDLLFDAFWCSLISIFCSQFISCAYCRRPPKAQFNWILRSEFPCETKVDSTSLEAKNGTLQHPVADTIGPRRMTLKNEHHARLDTAQGPPFFKHVNMKRRFRVSPEGLQALKSVLEISNTILGMCHVSIQYQIKCQMVNDAVKFRGNDSGMLPNASKVCASANCCLQVFE